MLPPLNANVTVVWFSTDGSTVCLVRVEEHLTETTFRCHCVEWHVHVCDIHDEGLSWCRDWSGSRVNALKAALL